MLTNAPTSNMFKFPHCFSLMSAFQDDGFGEAVEVEGDEANEAANSFIEEDLH